MPADLDIVTAAPPEAVAALLEQTVPIGAAFGVLGVVLEGHAYEVATFRREGPYLDGRRPSFVDFTDAVSDVSRRDFTINALLYDPVVDMVVDHVGGQKDLRHRVIRTVGPPAERFAEDRLRMLRAVRLAAELADVGFQIEPASLDAITALAPTITGVSAERIRDELLRLLVAPGRAEGIRTLAQTGLLDAVLPEVAAVGAAAAAGSAEAGSLLKHICRMLQYPVRPTPVLALAILLHRLDAAAVQHICHRLRLSVDQTRSVINLVAGHSRLRDVATMTRAQARRVLRRPDAPDLLELHRLDRAACGEDLASFYAAAETTASIAGDLAGEPRLLSGDDLIALGYPPGPQFAVMLEAVDEARGRGEIRTQEEARAFLLAHFPAGPHITTAETAERLDRDPHHGG